MHSGSRAAVLVAAAVLGAAGGRADGAPAQTATVTVSPASASVAGCDVVVVAVAIDATDLYGAAVRLSFDPSVLQVVDDDGDAAGVQVLPGGRLQGPLVTAVNAADNSAGTVEYAATQLNPTPPTSGSGDLIRARFRVARPESSPVRITYQRLGTRDGDVIPASTADGSVEASRIAAPSSLAIARLNSTTARLTWSDQPGVDEYHLYRDTYAYFAPGTTPLASTTGTVHDDVGAIGVTADNYFYVLRASCSWGLESPDSNRVGEFDFDFYRGDAPPLRKYSLVGYPLFQASVPNADALARYVDAIGHSVYQVIRHDNTTQLVSYWLPYIPPAGYGTNFPTVVGEPYFAWTESNGPSMVTFAGDVPAAGSVTFPLNRPGPETCRNNFVTIPLDRTDITTADELAADVGGVYMVARFDGPTQTIKARVPAANYGINFPVRTGYPYIVCATAAAPPSWP